MHALHFMNSLPWPLDGGRQINAHHLMRCLVERGHRATILLRDRPDEGELARWPLRSKVRVEVLEVGSEAGTWTRKCPDRGLRWWRRYWGVEDWVPQAAARVVEAVRPDYVEAIGLDTPLWMSAYPDVLKLWLAGDDPSLLHRTMIGRTRGVKAKARELRAMLTMQAYKRKVASVVDAAVAVSPADAAALRQAFDHVLLTPNGIDAAYFRPNEVDAEDQTAVFWGRLDFPPNVDAVTWFTREVWPRVRRRCPSARLRIVGRAPTAEVIAACAEREDEGVELIGAVADVRPWIASSAVTVLPMRGGAGIKNKLLEAAAMARPIAASPRAVAGLNAPADGHPWRTCEGPGAWAEALIDLWRNPSAAQRLGDAARRWVMTHHDWTSHAVAREAFAKRASDNISPGSSPAERRSALPGGGSRDVFPESLAA